VAYKLEILNFNADLHNHKISIVSYDEYCALKCLFSLLIVHSNDQAEVQVYAMNITILFCLFLLLVLENDLSFTSAVNQSIPLTEFFALKKFYYSTNGQNWRLNGYAKQWNFTDPFANNPCFDDWQVVAK
jgi:hypothetical protein